jgi:type III secretory pathway component EscU
MRPHSDNLRIVVDDLANALQTAVVLAGKLATSLRADAHDGDVLHASIVRAVAALQRLRPTKGAE